MHQCGAGESCLRGKVITAPLIWIDGEFRPNVYLTISDRGTISSVEVSAVRKEEKCENVCELKDAALLPGFVNAHSHAFHRMLRGRSGIGASEVDDFWKWRSSMYGLIQDIGADKFREYCRATFTEMLSSGITTVGEFHYVHHLHGGEHDFALDLVVIEAAAECGIRLVLINTLYSRSGFKAPGVGPEQARFACTLPELTVHMEKLAEKIAAESLPEKQVTLAVAAHSTRAVGLEDIRGLWEWAVAKRLPFHIHLEEQPKEIEDCMEANQGKRPSQLLLDCLGSSSSAGEALAPITCVHCTHTRREELEALADRGAIVCVCPLTEGFLGDGIPGLTARDSLSLGSDCNNRIDFFEEMRWLAYCQNMSGNRRNCAALTASKLIEIATKNGAQSLGLRGVGEFVPNSYMDFIVIDLKSQRSIADYVSAEQLADAIVFGSGSEVVKSVGVAGCVKYRRN